MATENISKPEVNLSVFLMLFIFMGIPSLFLSYWFAFHGFNAGQEMIQYMQKLVILDTREGLPALNFLPRILQILETSVHVNFIGTLLDFILTLIAYFASLALWVGHQRGQKSPALLMLWVHTSKSMVFRGSFIFFCLSFLSVFPLQPLSIVLGGLLMMGPVIMVVESTSGTRALGRALSLKYVRSPDQVRPKVFSTLMNLMMIYLAVYGMIGLLQIGEKLVMEMDWLRPDIHQYFYKPWRIFGIETPWTLGFLLAHLSGAFGRVAIAMFMGFSTVKLYFATVQSRPIASV